ncbi:hypothetical protein [Romboutsia lituseburensis]|uniref:Immunity protein 17 n=1 Tax=Romboutsia lituseburensis DSM 797 TaxID=1121325 RepID=A0A1G9TCW1_9FIRM|nr:hypothetical protein [Romboutsia lituseburensis]CEH36251.1 Hypothetical protein RLITU_3693 [Romboutsia lituseburensis]SDM45454.1 hypothetical protein SAMN04515677_11259 [Romboutsia lituseburensis DSM 797]
MLGVIIIVFGSILTAWGTFIIKNNNMLFGKNKISKNVFDLVINGEASGIGQFLGGIICIILGIISFIVK